MTCGYLYSMICGLMGISLFLYGFFFVNYNEGKLSASRSSHIQDDNIDIKPHFTKTVIVVIDALRYDFIVGNDTRSNWPYLGSLIEQDHACVFPCRVYLPTVTMPRIKAMTVGDASNFLDIVLNFGSSEIKHDNLIKQMKRKGMKIVFYGDDTWIKLFPNSFYRQQGVASFFVSDFYEVDNIVTKNVEYELKRDDWDVMILHYLGLDHIGHVEGPKSSKMTPKLQEMDDVVKKLHHYLLQWKTITNENFLLVVCTDHGMRNSGGHGGSSIQETLVPLVTIGIKCSSNKILKPESASSLRVRSLPLELGTKSLPSEMSQVDLAVTLSALMGLPIPYESIGKVVPQFIEELPLSERVDIYRRVTKHLIKKYIQIVGPLKPEIEDTFAYIHKIVNNDTDEACKMFQLLSDHLSSSLVAFLTKFDVFYLLSGVLITMQASYLPLTKNNVVFITFLKSLPVTVLILLLIFISSYFFGHRGIIHSLSRDNILVVYLIMLVIIFNMVLILQSRKLMFKRLSSAVSFIKNDRLLMFVVMALFLQLLSTLSTSLIEEEHMYWYFLWTTWLLLLLYQNSQKNLTNSLFALLLLHRVLKKFNQTGDQYISLPDIGDWFRAPERKLYLTIFLILELLWTSWIMRYRNEKENLEKTTITLKDIVVLVDRFVNAICLSLVFLYHAAVNDVTFFGNGFLSNGGSQEVKTFEYLLMISILPKLGKHFLSRQKSVAWSLIDVCVELWILIAALILQPHNVLLPGTLVLTSKWLIKTIRTGKNREIKIVVTHYWLAHVFFFYQGNSNSLATINVASGFIGQDEFSLSVAGILIFMSTYAMPILAYLLMVKEIQTFEKNTTELAVRLLLIIINVNVTFYFIVMILQRHHLFIWSVFSPKLLYVSVYSLILYPILIVALLVHRKE